MQVAGDLLPAGCQVGEVETVEPSRVAAKHAVGIFGTQASLISAIGRRLWGKVPSSWG